MDKRYDIVDIDGLRSEKLPSQKTGPHRAFLSIWYRCCHAYGRLYRNTTSTAYEGRCPRCGAGARVGIDPGGSNCRVFEAQ